MSDEPGTDLSTSTEVNCHICGVLLDTEHYPVHIKWHNDMPMRPSKGIYAGMPVEDAINLLTQQIQTLQNDKWMLENQLKDAITAIERTIGTEGNYRFVRDWTHL